MRYLVDSSVLIDHLRAVPEAEALLKAAAQAGDELWSVTVVRTEILAGMRPKEERGTRRLLDALRWQTVDVPIADAAGTLASRFMKSFPGVDTVDYIVAAATIALGAELWTTNVKHFPMFPDLQRPYP